MIKQRGKRNQLTCSILSFFNPNQRFDKSDDFSFKMKQKLLYENKYGKLVTLNYHSALCIKILKEVNKE